MRLRIAAAILALGAILATAADAQKFGIFQLGHGSGGGGGCTNSLIFSSACNSQYMFLGPLR